MTKQTMRQLNLAQLLRVPYQALVSELHARLTAQGYTDIPPTHTIVFALVDEKGIRLSELARRAQMTKQLVNYLVTTVEDRGYVERVPDPRDGRAKIVRLTPLGQQAAQTGSEIIKSIERDWAASLGQDDMNQLRSLLDQLVGAIERQDGH